MLDEPQTVGVEFNNAGGPDPPDLVEVSVRVRKTGDGAGRVTATGLDCGGTCSAKFKYGKLERFAVVADPGSIFGGWGGICASDKELRCTLPIGPVTLIRPRFVKEAPPSAPGALSRSSATETSITFSWGASNDDTGVKQYEVFVGTESAPRLSTTTTTATLVGLVCGTAYAIAVQAVDGAGNRSTRTSGELSTEACPLRVQFLGAKIVRAKTIRRLVVRLKSSVATRGSGTLFVGGKRIVRTGVVLRAGTNTLPTRCPGLRSAQRAPRAQTGGPEGRREDAQLQADGADVTAPPEGAAEEAPSEKSGGTPKAAPETAVGVAEDAASEVAEEAARGPADETPRRWRLSFGIVGQAAVVVGLIGGVVGLVFTFVPGLRPGSDGAPAADLELADVNGRATLREYLNSEGIPPGTLSPAALKLLGVLATIRYTSSGLGGKELPLVVSLTSRETGHAVCQHTYRVNAGSGTPLTFRSWSPFPATPQTGSDSYNLHVTLFPPDGQPPSLDADDENEIPGAAVAGPPLPLDLC